jgi:hypothetical protein
VAGIVIQLFVTANNDASFGGSALSRALNILAFFTILSNLLVGGTCLLLARPGPPLVGFRGFRWPTWLSP